MKTKKRTLADKKMKREVEFINEIVKCREKAKKKEWKTVAKILQVAIEEAMFISFRQYLITQKKAGKSIW